MMSRRGLNEPFVYFCVAALEGEVKIGYSVNPSNRRQALESTRHASLELAATVKGGPRLERQMHKRFAEYRIYGEWFQASPEIMLFIHSLRVNAAHADALKLDALRSKRRKLVKKADDNSFPSPSLHVVKRDAA